MKKRCISVYISGKITGLEREKAETNFWNARIKITKFFKASGFERVAVFNPMQKPGTFDGVSYTDSMEIDFMYINKCDAIYLMYDWQKSRGATMEWRYAMFMNKVVLYEGIKGDINIEDSKKYEELKKERIGD